MPERPRFLLIHGSCHGAWCWRDVLAELRGARYEAAAIDLPSHGDDPTPVADVTLDLYADAILAAIAAMGAPVVLVGHSMAGYPITAAAERAPEKIAKLVYLCAYAPAPGRSLADMRRAGPRQPLLEAIRVSRDGRSFTIDPDMAGAKFYNDCPPDVLAWAIPRLCPQAVLPQETPLALTGRSQGLERHYIRCSDDRTIPPEYQETMTEGWPPERVSVLPSSHSPFFSMPGALAQRLAAIAGGGRVSA